MSDFFTDHTVKFRELSADKVVYLFTDHTVELPQQLTVTSHMPVPRKGNPGAVKTSFNLRSTVILDAGKAAERVAPIVAKVDLSLPLGCTADDRRKVLKRLEDLFSYRDQELIALIGSGLLPAGGSADNLGDNDGGDGSIPVPPRPDSQA